MKVVTGWLATVVVIAILTFSFQGCKKKGEQSWVDPKKASSPKKPASTTQPEQKTSQPVNVMSPLFDKMWDEPAKGGKGKIRLQLIDNSEPYKGRNDARGQFAFNAQKLRVVNPGSMDESYENEGGGMSQSFNPSDGGKFVADDVDPGVYNVRVSTTDGSFREWKQDLVKVESGGAATYTVELSR